MHTYRPPIRWLFSFGVVMGVTFATGMVEAYIPPTRNPRDGVVQASRIVLVRQEVPDVFLVERAFLGDARPGETVRLPGFRLYTDPGRKPVIVEAIRPTTRILLFLAPSEDDPHRWEVCHYNYMFFWVHRPERVPELVAMAEYVVALRRAWEKAAAIPKPQARVEALWPFLWHHGVEFLHRTEAELAKTGEVAGDYVAGRLRGLSSGERMTLLPKLHRFGGRRLHAALVRHLRDVRRRYERAAERCGPGTITRENWENLPAEVRNASGETYYGLAGLAGFKDRGDLPFIRDLATWAASQGFVQTCEEALTAFRNMPSRENLPVIDAVWRELRAGSRLQSPLSPFEVTRCLRTHNFPETVPLLTQLLDDARAGSEARSFLTGIVGEDLGPAPGPWLDWYEKHKQQTPPKSLDDGG